MKRFCVPACLTIGAIVFIVLAARFSAKKPFGPLPLTLPGRQFVSFSPDGKYLGVRGEPNVTAILYDASTLDEIILLADDGYGSCHSLAWSPDGDVVVGAGAESRIRVWELPGGKLLHSFQAHSEGIRKVTWSREGSLVASGSLDETIKVWNVEDPKSWNLLRTLSQGAVVLDVAWNPDGRRLAAWSRKTLKLWDTQSGEVLAAIQSEERTDGLTNHRLAWSYDGERLALGSASGGVVVLNGQTGETQDTFGGHVAATTSVAWSPDDRRLLSGGQDGWVKILDAETGHALLELSTDNSELRAVAWSVDGRRVAGVNQGGLHIWDVGTIDGKEPEDPLGGPPNGDSENNER